MLLPALQNQTCSRTMIPWLMQKIGQKVKQFGSCFFRKTLINKIGCMRKCIKCNSDDILTRHIETGKLIDSSSFNKV